MVCIKSFMIRNLKKQVQMNDALVSFLIETIVRYEKKCIIDRVSGGVLWIKF